MCGIAGFLGPIKGIQPQALLEAMGDAMFRRGPDSGGLWMDSEARIGFSHRRLSILDLSETGHQPMSSRSGRYVICYNGEIYNHMDLRALHGGDFPWRGGSDTETLLETLSKFGIDKTLDLAIGMFAFALWDRSKRELILCRDRFGEKPLYYSRLGGLLLFASDLAALVRYPGFDSELDIEALTEYMRYNYIAAPRSIYRSTQKLEPGSYVIISRDGERVRNRYWSPLNSNQASEALVDQDLRVEVRKALRQAVGRQMVADVSVGAFLSGGLDSSLIVSLMQEHTSKRVKTFTVGFLNSEQSEAAHAREVARFLNTDHHELEVGPSEVLEAVLEMPKLYSEPFADYSQIPTYLVSKLASQSVKVCLTGDAGDELFGGYNRHFMAATYWPRVAKLPVALRSSLASLIHARTEEQWDSCTRWLPGATRHRNIGSKLYKVAGILGARNWNELYLRLVSRSHDPTACLVESMRGLENPVMPPECGDLEPVELMMRRDLIGYLPEDILVKVDRAAMGVSLESRVPFLDHNLATLAMGLPLDAKIRHGNGKWILRELLYEKVPQRLVERPKTGFEMPLSDWLRSDLKEWAGDLLSSQSLRKSDVFSAPNVLKLFSEHLSGKRNASQIIWQILMFVSWQEQAVPRLTLQQP